MRLVDQENVNWKNRAHFLGVAAEMMRRILVNHARDRAAAKRGGGAKRVSLSRLATVANNPILMSLLSIRPLRNLQFLIHAKAVSWN